MRSNLPTGTVTFLFTDVEGSTRLLTALGEAAWAEALAAHRAILRAAVAKHGGVEVDHQGDALFAAFPTAPGALAAAQEAERALSRGPLRVRMGLHTGTPHLAAEGYVGADVHRAARIAAAAHGGQIVLSDATRALAGAGFATSDLGEHRLKDVPAPERLHQLGFAQFPPLRSLSRTNLPAPANAFLGRARELAELLALLGREDVRLITVSGPGGTGKTRLAREAAAEVLDAFPGGVFWIGLDAVRDPAFVLPAITRELGASGELATHVGARRMLLVLDNFEQVAKAAGELGALLASCPALKLLVTSRERLRLSAEQEYALPPLAGDDAARLFTARARAALASFRDDGAVAAVCRRLDGLPLAIELAASRVKLLAPRALLERLERRLPLLTSGARDVPERQRTLRGAIAWSHDLLEPAERELFARLAVFAGGFTLLAAERVCGADVDSLAALLDKSLLRGDGERLGMLETIREFAAERLAELPDADALRRRHAEHALALLQSALDAIGTPEELPAFERADAELPNVRAAFGFALASGDGELALRIAVARSLSLRGRTDFSEARGWLERALATGAGPVALRARAHGECASDALASNQVADGDRHARATLALARESGDRNLEAGALRALCLCAIGLRDYAEADRFAREARELSEKTGDGQSMRLSIVFLGYAARGNGRIADARTWLEEAARLFGASGDTLSRAHVEHNVADTLLELGRLDEARRGYHDVLRSALLLRDKSLIGHCVAGLAAVAAEAGQPEDAARLWGAVEAAERREGFAITGFERDAYALRVERARAALGEEAFARAYAAGVALTPSQAPADAEAR